MTRLPVAESSGAGFVLRWSNGVPGHRFRRLESQKRTEKQDVEGGLTID